MHFPVTWDVKRLSSERGAARFNMADEAIITGAAATWVGSGNVSGTIINYPDTSTSNPNW